MAPLAALLALLLLPSGNPFGKKPRWGPAPGPVVGPMPPRIMSLEEIKLQGDERQRLEEKLPALADLLKEGVLGTALLNSFKTDSGHDLPPIKLVGDAGAYVAYYSFDRDLIGLSGEALREADSRRPRQELVDRAR